MRKQFLTTRTMVLAAGLAVALTTLPQIATAGHNDNVWRVDSSQQYAYEIKRINGQMNDQLHALRDWYSAARRQAHYRFEAARRSACNSYERQMAARAYSDELRSLRIANDNKRRAITQRASFERNIALRQLQASRRQFVTTPVVPPTVPHVHGPDCGCDTCRQKYRGQADCFEGQCEQPWLRGERFQAPLRGNVVPQVPRNVVPQFPSDAVRPGPPLGPLDRPAPPASGVRFNQDPWTTALMRLIWNR